MINIVIPNKEILLKINYYFIFNNYKIILFSELKDKLIEKENYLFFNSVVYPKKGYINKIINLIKKNSTFYYLCDNDDVFIVNSNNISFSNNEIDIKKTNNRIILFNKLGNYIDNIIPPIDLNFDYLFLLKHKTYDSKINSNIAYKAYEKFLLNQVKQDYCFNFILYINLTASKY